MLKLFKTTGVVLMAGLMFMATTGVAIHFHKCSRAFMPDVSFALSENYDNSSAGCCELLSEISTNNHNKEINAGKHSDNHHSTNNHHCDNNCCQNSYTYFKVAPQVIFPEHQKIQKPPINALAPSKILHFIQKKLVFETTLEPVNNPPPLLTGKAFVKYTHQFKIDFPS